MNSSVAAESRRHAVAARAIAIALGAANAWSTRHVVNPGGVSHLDMADAIVRGDFGDAVNGYFSPLYSIAIAPALPLVRGNPYYEATAVHSVHFVIYLLALFAFERFLRAVMDGARREGSTLPDCAWIWFGYAAFAWSALFNNSLTQMTGDLLVAALAYGAGAILVRMQHERASLAAGAALGLLLGLGYLAKTAMLPLSIVFLAAALLARSDWRANVRPTAAAAIVLLCVSLPFVTALSLQKGRVTAGDIGKLVYAWFVLDVPRYAHWQGDNPPGYGTPMHAERKLHASPDVFEYATPVIGTLPLFYDPSYWYEGLETPIRPAAIASALVTAALVYWRMAMDASVELLALGVLLFWQGGRDSLRRLARWWRPLLPVVAAFPMFALVHTEPRFVGGFVTMGLMLVLAVVRIPQDGSGRRIALVLLLGAAIVMGARTLGATVPMFKRGLAPHPAYEIAEGVRATGVRPGEQVAVVGAPFDAYWARLAGVRIVADVADYDVAKFWSASADTREAVLEKLRRAGVRHLVAFALPPGVSTTQWRRAGATGVFVLHLASGSSG